MAVSISKTKLGLVVAALLSLSFLQAQEARVLARHPGDAIKFEIKFDGPDAGKVTGVSLHFGLKGSAPADQVGFNEGLDGGSQTQSSPHTFIVEVKIAENDATGTYTLNQVSAGGPVGGKTYAPPDFQSFTVLVENPKTFVPPKVTVKQLP